MEGEANPMHSKPQLQDSFFRIISRAATNAPAMALTLALMMVLTQSAQAQTFNVIHNFSGGQDGANPTAGVTMSGAGTLYGTTYAGGMGAGTVYRLKRSGAGWVFDPLFSFDGADGAHAKARVVFGPEGLLYGTTDEGGAHGDGTVFNLGPSPRACTTVLCSWKETVLYQFTGGADGAHPLYGDLLFDQAGNIYGTTYSGGTGYGTVYELTPSGSGWTENVLHYFSGSDGALPYGGVVLDSAGNLYGTAAWGGTNNCGVVFQLTYSAGSGWTEKILYTFQCRNDGYFPYGAPIFDASGNLYASTLVGGLGGGGTIFELTPSSNGWTYNVLYNFTGNSDCGPWAALTMDEAGNLYGTTYCDGAYGYGSVFKLTPSAAGWTYTSLHDFTGGQDGGIPISNVIFDGNGILYGTTRAGGSQGLGVVWEITP